MNFLPILRLGLIFHQDQLMRPRKAHRHDIITSFWPRSQWSWAESTWPTPVAEPAFSTVPKKLPKSGEPLQMELGPIHGKGVTVHDPALECQTDSEMSLPLPGLTCHLTYCSFNVQNINK